MVWSTLILNNYLLFIQNSSLAGCLILLFAKSGNYSFWNKERHSTANTYTKSTLNETTTPLISRRCSEEPSDDGFLGLGASENEYGGAVCENCNQHFWICAIGLSCGWSACLALV